MFHTGDPGLRALEQRNLRARSQAFAALFDWAGRAVRWLGRGLALPLGPRAARARREHGASRGPGSRDSGAGSGAQDDGQVENPAPDH